MVGCISGSLDLIFGCNFIPMSIFFIVSGAMFVLGFSCYRGLILYIYIGVEGCLVVEKYQNIGLRNFMQGKCSVMGKCIVSMGQKR